MHLTHPDEEPVLWTDDLAEARLQQLGLPGSAPLRRAIHAGSAAARAVNSDHPVSYRGYRMFGETVEMLRKQLRPAGWDKDDLENIPLVVHRADPVVMIAVAPGDGSTGSLNQKSGPMLRYPKGPFSTKFYNGDLDDLWSRAEGNPYEVWLLVHHIYGLSVRSELSKPIHLDDAGQVTGWHERIVLPELGFDPEPRRLDTPERPPTREIVPDVRLRDVG